MSNHDVSIVIPNFNGMEYLPRCIGSLFQAFETYPGDHEIIVVDNGSTDGGVGWLRTHHPAVKVTEMGRNTGFAVACNQGAMQSRSQIIVLLNNDTFVREDFLQPLIRHFADDPDLFAVSCCLVDWHTGEFQLGRRRWTSDKGIIDLDDETTNPHASVCASDAISGSACAIRLEYYTKLGGFAHFHRWNDVDLSYRARKRGWHILYEPRSVVHHVGMATDRKVWPEDEIWQLWRKEMFLMSWRNISDVPLLIKHVASLPWIVRRFGMRRTSKALLQALSELPDVWRFRASERHHRVLADRNILDGRAQTGVVTRLSQ